jgi:alpha,alpha-trehalase
MMVPVTIDPRYHDAVIFGLDSIVTDTACIDPAPWAADGLPVSDSTVAFVRKLRDAEVLTAAYSLSRNRERVFTGAARREIFTVRVDGSDGELGVPGKPDSVILLEAARRLGVRPDRCVAIDGSVAGVIAGRDGGFCLVVGVDRMGMPTTCAEVGPIRW